MTEQIISFETAKLAKEKGYIEITFTVDQLSEENGIANAPTQSLLQKWLREKYNLIVEVVGSSIDKTFGIKIFYLGEIATKPSIGWPNAGDTYEEALEVGLLEALKLIS